MSNHTASPLEPSMEDILASIRRIIAEEDEQEARNARRARAEAEEAPPRVEAQQPRVEQPPRAEAPRPEPSRPEAPRAEVFREALREAPREAARPELPRPEALRAPEPPRPEPRRFRFEEPAPVEPPAPVAPPPPPAPAKVDWSGLGAAAREPEPPAPSRPAPRGGERLEEDFGWADRALGRPAPETEARFEFEIPFRESGDADLDADFGAILKSASASRPEPVAPPPPRVVESAYGGRFVEEPPRVPEPPAPSRPAAPPPAQIQAPPPAAAPTAPAVEDPFARFLNPPPSAFDDGYTLDPEAEPLKPLSSFRSEALDFDRKVEEAASSARRTVVDSADDAEAFLRRTASESFADLADLSGGAVETARGVGRSAFGAAADLAGQADRSADFLLDRAGEAASGAVETAREAGRSVFDAADGLLDKAADSTVEFTVETARGAADLAGEAVREAGRAGRSVFETAEDLAADAGRAAASAADFTVETARSAADLAAEAASSAADPLREAGRFVFETVADPVAEAADLAEEAAGNAADLAAEAAKATGEASRALVETAAPSIPELPVFEPPKFDLPDFAALREETSRRLETTRREVDDIFGSLSDLPAEPTRASSTLDPGEALDVFGVDRFSREDLDEGVLNLSSERRIPEAPPADPVAEPPPFDASSFWGPDSDFEPGRDPVSPLDIPPAPTEAESGFVREELLLTERLGEAEDPAAVWEAAGRSVATTAAASTALTARPSAPPAAISARRALVEEEDLLSEAAERASARAMAALSGSGAPRLHGGLALPGSEGEAESLNAVVRQMLKPMLREWLDENLPGMVERLVRAEVERVSARAAWSDQT